MAKLDYAEVVAAVNDLRNNSGLQSLYDRWRTTWEPLFSAVHVTELPERLRRGEAWALPSPLLRDLADYVLADFDSYDTTTTVVPYVAGGRTPSNDLKDKADKVENWCAVLLALVGEGALREASALQLYGPPAVLMPSYKVDEDGKYDFALEVPAVETCFYHVRRAPFVPDAFGREYEVTIAQAEKIYGRKYGSDERWHEVSDDRPEGQGGSFGGDKYSKRVKVRYYDDGEYIYRCLANGDDKGGEQVYCEPNLFGSVGAVVVAGATTPIRDPRSRNGPAFLAIMTMVMHLNLIRSMRMTKSANGQGDLIIRYTPEQLEAAKALGIIQAASAAQFAAGGPELIHLTGEEIVPWVPVPDLDLDKIEESITNELREYKYEWREPTDSQTVGSATANAYVTAVGTIRRRQTSVLKFRDQAVAKVLEMFLNVVRKAGKDDVELEDIFELYAPQSVSKSAGEVDAGTGVSLSAADLKDFKFAVVVSTKAQTEADMRVQAENDWVGVQRGYVTMQQLMEGQYRDATAQYERQMKDAGYRALRPRMIQDAYNGYADQVRLMGGVLVGGLALPVEAPGSLGAGGPSPMQPAAVGGPQGMSAAQ